MSAEVLKEHMNALSELLLHTWTSRHQCISKAIEKLSDGMHKYRSFLLQQQERNQQNHTATQPIRSVQNHFTLVDISAAKHVKTEFVQLDNELKESSTYEPVCLSGHPSVPSDRFDRRGWYESMAVSIPIAHYKYHQGNYKGNLHFYVENPSRQQQRHNCQHCGTDPQNVANVRNSPNEGRFPK